MKISRRNNRPCVIFKGFIICIIIVAFNFFASIEAQENIRMDTYYEEEGVGLKVWTDGASIIFEEHIEKESQFYIDDFENVRKVVLIWSGETGDKVAYFKRIVVRSPEGKTQVVKAEKVYRYISSGILYSCFADITSLYEGKGNYTIENIRTDPFERKDGDAYSVGGYAVVVIYKDKQDKQEKYVMMKSSLLALKPGEIYSIRILKKGSPLVLEQFIIIGGHGRKGNSSANLLNGQSISGEEDWDGSSGIYWDVDSFAACSEEIDIKGQGLVLSFDSLLQWIYPVSAVFVFEKEGN